MDNTLRIRQYCYKRGVEILAELPYDESVTEAMANGVPLVEYQDGPVAQGIKKAWGRIEEILEL
jgi:MinD superfamily P-loop ATPase